MKGVPIINKAPSDASRTRTRQLERDLQAMRERVQEARYAIIRARVRLGHGECRDSDLQAALDALGGRP